MYGFNDSGLYGLYRLRLCGLNHSGGNEQHFVQLRTALLQLRVPAQNRLLRNLENLADAVQTDALGGRITIDDVASRWDSRSAVFVNPFAVG